MKEILSNHPGLPKDIDFNKLNGKYIHFSQEKDDEEIVDGGWNQFEEEEEEGDGDVNDDFFVFKNTRAPGPDSWQEKKTTTPSVPEAEAPEEDTDDSIAD